GLVHHLLLIVYLRIRLIRHVIFFFQAEDGIRDRNVTGVQTCALPIPRGIEEAVDVLQYANAPQGIALSDRRAANGSPEPHGIRMWCLGNELDGPWPTGHKTAKEYARLAAETARATRQEGPGLELIACGSSNSQMETFGAWENTVLTEAYDHVDMISAHAYYAERDGDQASFLASADDMDHFIESVVATADHVRAKLKR